jgi:rod shape-determining protein MreD
MNARTLALPGDRRRSEIRPSRALAALLAGFLWLPVQATLLPALGIGALPLDPLLPLVAAFALGGRRAEAWVLALSLGFLADFYTGVASGRMVLQYAVVVLLATPMYGRVVLRDRLVPVFGVFMLSLASGAVVLFLLVMMGGAQPGEQARMPLEAVGTAGAAFLLWPVYRRIAGWQDERSMSLGRR